MFTSFRRANLNFLPRLTAPGLRCLRCLRCSQALKAAQVFCLPGADDARDRFLGAARDHVELEQRLRMWDEAQTRPWWPQR